MALCRVLTPGKRQSPGTKETGPGFRATSCGEVALVRRKRDQFSDFVGYRGLTKAFRLNLTEAVQRRHATVRNVGRLEKESGRRIADPARKDGFDRRGREPGIGGRERRNRARVAPYRL